MRITERDLERLAPHLGAGGEAELDVDRVAAGVTARLRAAGGPVEPRPIGRWLALAASVALVAGAALFTFSAGGPPPGAPFAITVVGPGLHDLSTSELDAVLDSLGRAVPLRLDGRSTLDDLDTEQLQTLLTLMEG